MLVEESDAHSELSKDERASATSEVVSKVPRSASFARLKANESLRPGIRDTGLPQGRGSAVSLRARRFLHVRF